MPDDCPTKFPYCIYVERNAEISHENEELKGDVEKLKEEIQILQSDKRVLADLIVKLTRMLLGC